MELRKSRRLLEVLVGAAAEKERKRKERKRKGRDVLTPILWNHKRHLLTGEKRS